MVQKIHTATSSDVIEAPGAMRIRIGKISAERGINSRTARSLMFCVAVWRILSAWPETKKSRMLVYRDTKNVSVERAAFWIHIPTDRVAFCVHTQAVCQNPDEGGSAAVSTLDASSVPADTTGMEDDAFVTFAVTEESASGSATAMPSRGSSPRSNN